MTDNVIRLVPPAAEQAPDVDTLLAAWLGKLSDVVLVGTTIRGDLIVVGSQTAAESVLLLAQGSHVIVSGTLGDE